MMNIRFATDIEIDSWDSQVALNPSGGSVFQVKAFAEIKQSNLWTPRFIVIDSIYSLVLERTLPLLGKFWYMPKGPGVNSVSELEKIVPDLKKFASMHDVFTVRIEPEIIESEEVDKYLSKMGLVKSKGIQAANTIIIDISKPIDDVVAGFSGKTRYNIRQAEKAGVTSKLVDINDENCKIFYDLMSTTIAGRSYVRPYSYFKKFWESYGNSGTGLFMFAYSNDELQAADFIMLNGTKAARKDAGSSREHAIRGASAILEVEAIKELQKRGIVEYDLYGSPPAARLKDPTHPFYGFGSFKAGFNETVTDYVGCIDIPIKPLAHKYWTRYGERLAHRQHRQKHGDRYY